MKASIGGEKGRHMLPRLVQNVAEGRTLRVEKLRVKVMIQNQQQKYILKT